ncbi:hypothetical protein VTO42DRAFT_7793 [Malbranchea cinnamomea]
MSGRDDRTNDQNYQDNAEPSEAISAASPSRAGPSLLQEFIALHTAMGATFKHPMEVARMVGSSVLQFGSRLVSLDFRPERDIVSQTGRVILVTGGNTGLGKQTILQLAKHRPARIYLAARSEKKGRDAIQSIQASLGSDPPTVDIRYLPLDLASFKSIRAAVSQFTSECHRLDTLILNAGVMALPPGKTEDGFEIQFGTNHVGHFLLTKLLLPTLRRTTEVPGSDVRVISVSSMAWQMAPFSVSSALSLMTSTEALYAQNTWTCYGVSKAANILFAAELARRYPEITAVSVHPGVIFTGLYETYNRRNPVVKAGLQVISPFVSGEERGALNHLWAAGVAKEKLTNGEYYTPVGVRGWNNPFAHDVEAGRKLWEWTDEQVSRMA